MTTPREKLAALGIILPQPARPVANYVGWVRTGNLVFVAGQLPLRDGKVLATGLCGTAVSKEQAKEAARACAINILAQINDALDGDLSRVTRTVKLTGFVACEAGFLDHPFVVNGASDLMAEVFGEAGRHARAAVGVASLPINACVEVDAIFEVN